MIGRLFSAALAAGVLASTITVQAKTAASPLVALQLKGHWVCAQTGSSSGTYNEDWTAAFGGTWLRATDSTTKGQVTGEHTVTFNKATSTWVVLDAFLPGSYDVLHGTSASPNHIAFHAVYPKLALAVTYNRLSPASYTIDVNGNVQGKKVLTRSVCTKP
jgi:hypothetical protein